VGLIFFSEPFIQLLLGDAWVEMAHLFSLMSISAVFVAYRLSFRVIFNAIRFPKFHFYTSMISLLIYIPSAYLSVVFENYYYMAYGVIASNFCLVAFSVFMLYKRCNVNVLTCLWRSILLFAAFCLLALLIFLLPIPEVAAMFIYGVLALFFLFLKNKIWGDQVINDLVAVIGPKLTSILRLNKRSSKT
jgi:O-antigen/teichoic acid export membrane protein